MADKPTYEELKQKIKELEKQVAGKESPQTEDKPQTTSAAPEKETGVEAKKRILVIDDSEIDRMVIEEILTQAGYEVISASDGKEGLERFNANPTDLVITDMVMPEKMGIDVIWELKKEYPDLKIIAMSSGSYLGPEIELSMARTLEAYTITKPFDPAKVLKIVTELLSQADEPEQTGQDEQENVDKGGGEKVSK